MHCLLQHGVIEEKSLLLCVQQRALLAISALTLQQFFLPYLVIPYRFVNPCNLRLAAWFVAELFINAI